MPLLPWEVLLRLLRLATLPIHTSLPHYPSLILFSLPPSCDLLRHHSLFCDSELQGSLVAVDTTTTTAAGGWGIIAPRYGLLAAYYWLHVVSLVC
jgi:hypothetical protein